MTRRISVMAVTSALVLVAAWAAEAKKPPGGKGPSSVTITAAPNPILYGHSVAISGKLTAKTVAGVSVTLTLGASSIRRFIGADRCVRI
jgi:hypothetical protein